MSFCVRTALFLLLSSFQHSSAQNKVLICVSPGAYAYHTKHCSRLDRCTHIIKEVTLKEAQDMGRDSCETCYHYSRTAKPVSQPIFSPASSQCQAITKKGTQCSRKAGTSGFCWQHVE